MEFRKINHRTILTSIALLVIPIALVAILFPILSIIQVPRLGLNGRYLKTVDKHVYYLLVMIPD